MIRILFPPGLLSPIQQGTRVRATEEYRTRYWKEKPNVSELSTVEVEIIAYDGQGSAPQFMDDEPGEPLLALF